MIIAVDLDGTICENKYPDIGSPNISIIKALQKARERGNKVILWTCRCDEKLDEALNWCKEHNIEFDAVNDNLPDRQMLFGNNSRKIGADQYWDDKAVNINKLMREFSE